MKVVQIITRMDDVGGAQIHVRDIATRLRRAGHAIYIITGERENIHTSIEEKGIQLINCRSLIRDLDFLSDVKAILEIRKYLREIKPDLIATHSSKAGIVGRIAGWSLRIPTIFTAHGWSYTEGIPKKRKILYVVIEKLIGHISGGVITVSEYDKQLALKYKVLPEKKVNMIHNGVHDFDEISRVNHVNKIPNIIMVARFAPPKKQLQLLKVLNQIKHIQWKVTFVGDGPLLDESKSYVEREGISERVSFLGNRKDVTELLLKADIFVLLSDWEGLPLSILEAMRCGLPIIASDVGGVREAVMHLENGFLVPKSDYQKLQNDMQKLLMDSTLRLKMGNKSRKLYEEHFKFEKMFKKTLSYYEEVSRTNEAQTTR